MFWVRCRHGCAALAFALVLVLAGPTRAPAYTVLSRIDHPCDLAPSRSTPEEAAGATGNLSCVHGVGLAGNSSALSILSGNLSLPPLTVDPMQQTLLTVQLFGDEHLQAGAGGGSGSVTVSSADGRPGHGNESWKPACPGVIGCIVESSPRLLGRWVYMSIVLPPGWTAGRHQVQLVLTVGGSASPLLFSIVTHVGAAVQPTAPQGTAPPLPPPRPPKSALTPHRILQKAVDEGVTLAKGFQLWGTAWDARVATGAAPAVMTGAFARGTPSSYNGSAASLQEWKDKVICSTLGSNNNYLRLAELFARAYTTVELPDHYQNPELLLRVTAALDFYTVAQGSNGGYDDRNHGKCWVGAPQRAAADGVLEGYGHTGFASAFLTLHKKFEAQGVLEQTFDDDDNSTTPNVTRRDGWAQLLNMSRVHMTSQKYRGHASNQDCSDQMAGWEDNQGLKALNVNLSWIDSKEWPYVLQCLGVTPGPDGIGSWWISPMGISQEPGGARGGGYSHAYGETPGRQMVKLALEMGHEQTVGRRLMDWLRAFAHFRFLDAADIDANSSDNASGTQKQYRTVWSVSSITWRHEHLNGDYGKYGIMAANGYGALYLRDSWAHRMCELWLAHNEIHYLDLTSKTATSNVHWPDILNGWMLFLPMIQAVTELPPSHTLLPFEDKSENWAFADPMSGALSVKTKRYELYASVMWRGKPHARGTIEPGQANNLSKIEYRGSSYGQVGVVPTEDQAGVWSLEYGDLAVGMNSHMLSELDGARVWTVPQSMHGAAAVNLVNGQVWKTVPPTMVLGAQTAVVLRKGA